MKTTSARVVIAIVLAAAGAALAASCSVPRVADGDHVVPSHGSTPRRAWHIAQLDFGRRASFATCVPPACPAVTPKTLSGDPQPPSPVAPASPAARSVEASASLGRGETMLAAEQRPPVPPAPPARPASAPDTANPTKQIVVHFAFGNATLSPVARTLIDEAAGSLPSARRIAISGRTDSVGPREVNQALALARAEAVREHLRARYPGLSSAVTVEAEGACCYAATNDTPQGRAMNRRVEILFEREARDL